MQDIRHDWQQQEVQAFYDMPFMDLIHKAHTIHRQYFDPNTVQLSSLLSVKTGACPEDCAYCPQSAHYDTRLKTEKLMAIEDVIENAKAAKNNGASRFCMGAAWRNPPKKDFPKILEMIKEVKKLGLESCVTLGMLDQEQAQQLHEAGLDFYNHNLDSSPEFYKKIITTRTYQDRISTLENVREAGIKVCCGGIISMGETQNDRIGLLLQLANQPVHPESVPINLLIQVPGTPLEKTNPIDSFEFIRTIAAARIMMPQSYVRFSAGRENMNDEMQALCFFAGVNSIFIGEKLLTTSNPSPNHDQQLFTKLKIKASHSASEK